LEEWVELEDTEFERECEEWTGIKSSGMFADIICILTAAMWEIRRNGGPAAGIRKVVYKGL